MTPYSVYFRHSTAAPCCFSSFAVTFTRASLRDAKSRKARIWKSYESKVQVIKNKNFTGKVIQIIYADSIALKLEDGSVKTIHLSSIRPPK